MISVRFHGRGGQGAKTAGRILGTAAFLEGLTAQDSPIYGAERRGAPVAAFTRIAQEPICERGIITHPGFVVVADATLINDPAARVHEGINEETVVFVNSPVSPEEIRAQTPIQGRLATFNVTGLALQELGAQGTISALLGSIAGRLVGLRWEALRRAIARELSELRLPAATVDRNQTAALQCYHALPPIPRETLASPPVAPARLWTPIYEAPSRGTARISAAANSVLRETGGWRMFRPVLVAEKCNGCWLCFVYCPDGVISMSKDDKPVIDYDHCKGCRICVYECPTDALIAERETVKADNA